MDTLTFGEWVKNRRMMLDLTQEILAARVDCSLSAIRKIEGDERRPSRQVAEILAAHLDVLPAERGLFVQVARGERPLEQLNYLGRQAASPGLLAVAPGIHSSPAAIPIPPLPLVGRQQELASLQRMLADPYNRLITILGPGGIGKTRLAVEAALAQQTAFAVQVTYVQLASFISAEATLPAIAAAFGIPSSNTTELTTARLIDYLHDKSLLLVLDNFEHLLDSATLLAELLQRVPLLKILVTSRERLNIQGEWTFELSGLSVPPAGDEGYAVYSALQLFEQHALRMHPAIQIAGPERAAAIRICQQVGGMPLAIELAAAWANLLSCQEIASEIARSLDFLSASPRDFAPRHKSLRAVFEYSWQRLSTEEQHVLSQLAVFQGGFDRAAAQAVTGADLTILASLASRSLLRRSESGRLDLHEVIRQYALDHLTGGEALRRRHSAYYLDLLHRSEPVLYGNDSVGRIHELGFEYGNFHLAWNQALKQKMMTALDLALPGCWMAYDTLGWLQEGVSQTRGLIQCLRAEAKTGAQQVFLGRGLAFCGMFLFRAGGYSEARSLLEESIAILRETGKTHHLIPALVFCGIVTALMGELALARSLIDEGVQLSAAHHQAWFLALGQFNQGFIAGQAGGLDYAWERMQAGLSIWRDLGNVRFIAFALNFLSPVAVQSGRLADARTYLEESLALSTQINDRWGMGTASGRLGMLDLLEGNLSSAKTLLEQSLALFRDLGARWDVAWAMTQLGQVSLVAGDYPAAGRTLQRAVQLALETQALPQALEAAQVLANCRAQEGHLQAAYKIVLHILKQPASTQVTCQQAGDLREKLAEMLPPDELEDLQVAVEGETVEEALLGIRQW